MKEKRSAPRGNSRIPWRIDSMYEGQIDIEQLMKLSDAIPASDR